MPETKYDTEFIEILINLGRKNVYNSTTNDKKELYDKFMKLEWIPKTVLLEFQKIKNKEKEKTIESWNKLYQEKEQEVQELKNSLQNKLLQNQELKYKLGELKESLLKLAKQRDELLIQSQKYNFQEYEKEIQELKDKLKNTEKVLALFSIKGTFGDYIQRLQAEIEKLQKENEDLKKLIIQNKKINDDLVESLCGSNVNKHTEIQNLKNEIKELKKGVK